MINVLIAIQARSTSTRFPKKVFELLDGKEILQHVIDKAKEACSYINHYTDKNKVFCKYVLLIPYGDEIKNKYAKNNVIIEGDEHDVLSRFFTALQFIRTDYVVRITSDCPLIPSYLISKAINIAVKGEFDYVSNVDPEVRTCPDGHDVEVISRRALDWSFNNAFEQSEREHVTTILRSDKIPKQFRIAHIIGHIYDPCFKISLDTQEDLNNIKVEYEKVKNCLEKAAKLHGKGSIFRV